MNIILQRGPIRSNIIGNPARIFVMMNVIKYPTTFGRDLPRIARILEGCSMISPIESSIDPAVTVMKILASYKWVGMETKKMSVQSKYKILYMSMKAEKETV